MAYYRRMNREGTDSAIGTEYYQRHYHDAVTCDKCAEAGAVPFETLSDGTPMQSRPWCWAPRYGDKCEKCGAEC